MLELAERVGMIEPGALLPTGVIVGSAVIGKSRRLIHRTPKGYSNGICLMSTAPGSFASPDCILSHFGSIHSDTQQETRPGNGAPGRV